MKQPFIKPFLFFSLLGLVGITGLVPLLQKLLEQQLSALPDLPPFPLPVILLLSLIQPAILMLMFVAIGVILAPRLQFHSHLYQKAAEKAVVWNALKRDVWLPVGSGLATGVLLVLFDHLFQPYLPASLTIASNRGWVETVSGMLYGGITEELVMRWGLMTLIVWILWKLFQRNSDKPKAFFVWVGILLSAFLFGVGHLGAVSLLSPLTSVVILRTILLNSIGGIIYGWLFWKRNLESGMIAHAMTHVGITAAVLLG